MRRSTIVLIVTTVIAVTGMSLCAPSSPKFKGLPLVISFPKNKPPDSVQGMIKNYFQSKKYKVISFEESMELFQAQAKFDLMNAINSGTFDDKTAKTLPSKMSSYSNVLSITIFRDSTTKNEYTIDSIQWVVAQLPVKETQKSQPTFIPDSSIRSNIYTVVKEFSEKVIASKLLR